MAPFLTWGPVGDSEPFTEIGVKEKKEKNFVVAVVKMMNSFGVTVVRFV